MELQSQLNKANATHAKKVIKLDILNVLRTVLILVDKQKGHLSDDEVVKAADGGLKDKILKFDEQLIK